MPVYQAVIEIDDPKKENCLMDHVEYIESRRLIEAANKANEHAKMLDGELKSVRYATPTPMKI